VNNLNFEVKDREFMVLLGPSGAGKTTTLRCIAGTEKPVKGHIFFDDILVNDLSPRDRNVAMVFQSYALYTHWSVYDNLASPLKANKLSKAEIDGRVKEVAELLHISHLLNRDVMSLSGGEQQRVALGRSLVKQPRVLLLDEPLTNLDAKLRAELRVELRRLQMDLGYTTILATPDQLEAMSMADRITVINYGVLQQCGTPREIYEHPANMFVAGFIGSPAMNFLKGTCIEKKGKILIDFGVFTYDVTEFTDLLKDFVGSELIFGIRPQDLSVNRQRTTKEALEVTVYEKEPLGYETIVNLRVGDHLIKTIAPPGFKVDVGDKVWLGFNKDKIHLFDAKTQKAVA
jgi:ABC-type sugar transport system ATPase subunit